MELYIMRLLSGRLLYKPAKLFLVNTPLKYKYLAEELYQYHYRDCLKKGLYNKDTLLEFLLENNIWSAEQEKQVEELGKQIEEAKVYYFQKYPDINLRIQVLREINAGEEKLSNLTLLKHSYDHLSCSGIAAIIKQKYLIRHSLRDLRDGKVKVSEDILDKVFQFYMASRLKDSQLRKIARSELWRSYWCLGKPRSIFGTLNLNDEQKSLCMYSMMYDNIYKHPESPNDAVISDDYALDGWMILQKRKRDREKFQKEADNLIMNPKIRESQEVYLKARNLEEARKIDDLNDAGSKAIKRERFNLLKQKGAASELEMPDVRRRLQMELNKMYSQGRKHG